jgi:hypothetical protein
MGDRAELLEHMINELTGTELEAGDYSLWIEMERSGSLMIDRGEDDVVWFATPDWEGEHNTLAFAVDFDGFYEDWTLVVEWASDWEVAVEQWRDAVRCQLPSLLAAEQRQRETAQHYREQQQAEADRRTAQERLRCPVCGAKVHHCLTGEADCIHCDSCWWVGFEAQAARAS